MFEGLLKPKFYSKCKSCLKLIKTRLEAIRKKRNAVQKFLKKDIADLLRSAHDYNAYGRAEGLLVEQNMSACYELIAKFVGCISDHVRDLSKQKECHDECKEAIPSLIYAAARFSDLPELRELRTLFTQKFGDSLERYISKEFVEKLRQDPPSRERKIQLLHDLAQEFSIEWDNKALEQTLYSPPLLHDEKPKHDPQNDYGDVKWHKKNDDINPKIDDLVTATYKGNERDVLSQGSKDTSDVSWSSDNETTTTDTSSWDGSKACSSSLENVSEDEAEIKRPFSYALVPPPYVIEKFNKGESNLKKTSEAALPEKESIHEPVVQKKPIPRSVRQRPRKPPSGENTVTDYKTGDAAKLESGGMKSENSRDKEEKIIDGLLIHYSKKQSPYESGIGKEYTSQQRECDNNVSLVRGKSLPLEDTTSMETIKGHGRATSLVPEMLRTAGRVHPCLPDYDDLRARLAALRGQ